MAHLSLLQLLLAAGAVLATSQASASHKTSRALSFPVLSRASPSSLDKRDQDIKLYGNSSSIQFFIQCSDETWVNPNCSISGIDKNECLANGIYQPSSSSTTRGTNITSSFTYADGSSVGLTYYTDTITFTTGLQVPNVQFGVGDNSSGSLTSGVLGLGFGESTQNTNYQNFIDQLASSKVTNSKAFTLALGNGTVSGESVIIFGGVDTKKFSGQLVSNDILGPQYGESLARYWIEMTSIGVNTTNGTHKTYSGGNAAAVIDAGTTLTYLPDTVVNAIARDFNATIDQSQGGFVISCSSIPNGTYLTYTFGRITINVPLREINFRIDGDSCFLGIQSSGNIFPILGLNFIRYAYIVFDQTLNTISLANYVNCGQNEKDMPSSGAAGFVGECTPTVSTSSSSNSTIASPPSQTSIYHSGLSTGAKAGIGVGVAVGVIAIIAALLYFFLLPARRKQVKNEPSKSPTSYPEVASGNSYKQGDGPMAEIDGRSHVPELDGYGHAKANQTQVEPAELDAYRPAEMEARNPPPQLPNLNFESGHATSTQR